MQIIFQTQKPINIKGSFTFDRTLNSINDDCITNLFVELAGNLSESFSIEPVEIEIYPNVKLSDFVHENYNSKKTINLIFKRLDNDSDELKTFEIAVYFDSANERLINEKIKGEHVFYMKQEEFEMLDTVITKLPPNIE